MESHPLVLPLMRAALLVGAALALYPPIAWIDRWAELAPGERERLPRHPLLPLAYALKLLSKRASLPAGADRLLHIVAPFFAFLPGMLILACLPPGPSLSTADATIALGVASEHATLPLVLGLFFASTGGIALAGWAGGNPLALLGALRLVLVRTGVLVVVALASLGVALVGESLSLAALLDAQGRELVLGVPALGALTNPIGFAAALVALGVLGQRMAKSRPGESADLVEPYAAEATGPTLLLHRGFEIIDLAATSAFLATLFLGGWLIPGLDEGALPVTSLGAALPRVLVFLAKTLLAAGLLVLARRALPTLRHDQALTLTWLLIPAAALGLLLSGGVVARLL